VSLATSTSAKALQRSSADKACYLYDGSLLIAYWNGSNGQVAQVTSPLTSPSVTNLFTTTEDGVSLWADNSSGTSSYIWVASSFDDGSGSGPGLHVRSGTYTSGGGFTWNTATSVPGTTTSATIQCSVTWNGTYLMVFLWDGSSGTDRLSYACTADKTGQSGWTGERTLNGGTWSTITQVAARHSAKLGATVIAYGGNSRMFYGALPDGTLGQTTGATASETGSWSGTATTAAAAGIIAAVKPSGTSPVLACGSTAQVRATAGSVTSAWGNGQVRTAGNLLVAAVSATGTTSAATISTPSGWSQAFTVGGGTAATCAVYTKTAAGSDAAPAFTSTISGTATMAAQLLELVNAATSSIFDTSGTNTGSGTVSSLALTTSGNVTGGGDYLLSVLVRERSAGTTTYTPGSGWLNVVNDGSTSSTGHCSLDVKGAGPELNNWAGNGATGFYSFADNYTNFGGPQLVIDEATGDIHCVRAMTTGGGPTNSGICYWHGTYSSGTVSWSSVLVVDADGGTTTPADIGAAVDGSSALYVTYTDAATAGNLKYAKLVSPFTSVSSGPTVIVAGSGTVSARWPHSPPVSASMAGLGTALPVLYTNTFSSPYPILLDTSVTLPGGAVPGAASLSGSGTIAAAAAVQFASATTLTGTGTLTPAGLVTQPAAASLSGSGALAAASPVRFAGAAALSGAGTVTAAAAVTFTSAAALSGSGSLAASGQKTVPAAAALSGSGTLTAPRSAGFPAAAALSGSGGLSAAGLAAFAPSAALSGTGALASQGAVTQPASAVLSGSGSLVPAGVVQFTSACALSGAGSLAASAGVQFTSGAALSGSGSLTAAGLVTQPASAALSGAGSVAAGLLLGSAPSVPLSGLGVLAASGLAVQPAASALSGTGTLGAAAAVAFASGAALSGAGVLSAGGTVQFPGAAALTGTGALAAAALVTQPGSAALSGTGSLTAAALAQFTSAAVLSGSGALTAAALAVQPAAAALSGSGTVTAAASVRFTSGAGLSGAGSLTAAVSVSGLAAGSANLAGSGSLAAAAAVQFAAGVLLSGSGGLAAAALVTQPASAALAGSGSLAAGVSVQFTAASALSGSGTLAAAALVTQPGAAALAGSGTLAAAASPVLWQAAALAGSGTMGAAALVASPGGAPLSGAGFLLAAVSVTVPASAAFAGQGALAAGAVLAVSAAAPLLGAGVISVSVRAAGAGFTGTVTWTARAAPPRWRAEAGRPRWHAQAAPSRWRVTETAPRWQVTATAPRWRIVMGNFAPIAAVSLEEVNVTWTSELAGTSIDPTGVSAGSTLLPVQMAFPVSTGNPAAPASPSVWFTATWLLGGTSIGYVSQALVGPGGVVTLTAGMAFDVFGKISGSPESPVKFAGTIDVF
jgi:fibronectin-binding autotransporter adhesin